MLSPTVTPAVPVATVAILGEDKGGGIWLTACWFEGRMFREGAVGEVAVGEVACGAIWVEVRLEVVLEVRRGDEAKGRGEGGTEFKSGAMALGEGLCENDSFEIVAIVSRRDHVSLVLCPWL